MSDVSVEDGSVTGDIPAGSFGGGGGTEVNVNQVVNQSQAQLAAQQQQQAQGPVPVFLTPFTGQSQFQGSPFVLLPLSTHTQVQGLLAQLQGMLGG
jgi:hypothetical protein